MKKFPKLLGILLSTVLAIVLILPGKASAQADGIQESFDDPTLPGWEHPPEATVTEGVLAIQPGGYALHFGDWSDINLSIKVRFSGEGEAIIRYYFRDQGSYILSISAGGLTIQKEQLQSRTVLGSADATGSWTDMWLNIKVVISGGQQQVYVNDELQLNVNDIESLPAGAIMLSSQGPITVEFDDLDVQGTAIGGQPQGEGNAPPEAAPVISPAEEAAGTLQVVPTNDRSVSGGIIEEFFSSQPNTFELTTFLVNLILAAICAYILGLVYIHWGSSLTNRRKFATNFMLLTITTTFIIMVVGSSVALSLGLVGALSIVRFRTAVKEPEELAYLFVAIGIGIGLGDNQRLITLLALAAVIAIIFLQKFFRRLDADVNFHLAIASHNPHKVELEQLMTVLRPHVRKMKLMRYDETDDIIEAAFLVEFGRIDHLSEARSALKDLSGSLEVTFMDNKGLW